MGKLTTEIEVKIGNAKAEIDRLKDAIKKGDGDIAGMKDQLAKLEKELKNSERDFRGIKKATEDASKSFKGLGDSIKGIDGSSDSIKSFIGSLGDAKGAMSGMSAAGMGMGEVIGALVNPYALAAAAVAGVGAVMVDACKKATEFQVSLNDLQALTSLSDEDMKGLSQSILDISNTTAMSAKDIAASMGLIGSQAPELLKNKDALAEVTEAANTLAVAAGITAEDAAKGITTIMNQLGVSASESKNIINTLASAQANGSASVEYLNTAIEKSGTQAKGAGMSYRQLVAVIESIAPKFSSADVAGSQLSSTLLKLSMGADEFNPAVVGMKQALDNLSAAELDNAGLNGIVGESNITMIKSLIEAKDSMVDFEASITDTNAAFDQFAIKNKGMSAATANLSNSWDNFLISLGSSESMQVIMDALTDAVNGIASALQWASKHTTTLVEYFKLLNAPLITIVNFITGIGKTIKDLCTGNWSVAKLKENFSALLSPLKSIKKIWDDLFNGSKGSFEGVVNTVKGSFNGNNQDKKDGNPDKKDKPKELTEEEKEELERQRQEAKKKLEEQQKLNRQLLDSDHQLNLKLLQSIEDKEARELALLEENNQYKLAKYKEDYENAKTWQEKQIAENNIKATEVEYNQGLDEIFKKPDSTSGLQLSIPVGINQEQVAEDMKNSISQAMEGVEFPKIELEVDTETLLNNTASAFEYLSNIMSNVSKITENESINVAAIMAGTVANLLKGYAAATAQASSLGPWGWAAFALSGLAEVTAVIAQVKSLGKYADGGIVSGSSTLGDFNIARVNSGEMILNGTQQRSLFNQLNQPQAQNERGSANANVQFKISGRELVGVLNNYNTFRN